MVRIGITYSSKDSLWFSGANQTAVTLAEVFTDLGHKVTFLDHGNESVWKDASLLPLLPTASIHHAVRFDWLIDIDGRIAPTMRTRVATTSFVFLRTFLQFTEMDSTVYLETPFQNRDLKGVKEIWCWDILNPADTLPSIQTLFPCPIRRVPFVWSSRVAEHYSKTTFDAGDTWTVHVAEKNQENTSSSLLPLVAIRELVRKEVLPAIYQVHNMDRIKDNRFLKENVLDNIEISTLPITMVPKSAFYEWSSASILFSHSRFVPLRIGLLNALWLGIPLIHNSPVLRDLHPLLASTFYTGNHIGEIVKAFSWLTSHTWEREEIRQALRVFCSKRTEWGAFLTPLSSQPLVQIPSLIPTKGLVIAFSDMWPGFYPDSNFLIDLIRQETAVRGVLYHSSVVPDLLIVGPYGYEWRKIKKVPIIFFSAENWSLPQDDSIRLYLTSSRLEDATHVRIPTWMTFIDWYSKTTELPTNTEHNPIRMPLHFATTAHPVPFSKREHFCGFVVSNPCCTFRNETFHAVHAYKHVDSGGAIYNNIGGQLELKYPGGGCGDLSKYHFFSDRRFSISFENSQAPGYITEKVLHAKMAGCIPLYWGDSDSDFAPHSFINLSSTCDPSKVVEIVKKLEASPEICEAIASRPILNQEKVEKAFDRLATIRKAIMRLLAPAMERIEKSYVINLDTRQDRWTNLLRDQPELAHLVERVSGVNGKTLQLTSEIYRLFENNQFQWKKSIMGCNLSHLSVWNKIAEQTSGDYFLVLEDDVRFHPHWMENWKAYAADIPLDADLLYLGGVLPPNRAALPKVLQKVNEHWSSIQPNTFFSPVPAPVFHFCAYSYILTRKGAQKLVSFMEGATNRSFTVSDHLLGHPSLGLVKYIATPLLSYCFQEEDPVYHNSQFNELHREDKFDSDIWNNKECFTEADLAPFRGRTVYYLSANADAKQEPYEQAWLEEILGTALRFQRIPERMVSSELVPDSWFLVQRPHVSIFENFFQQLNHASIPFRVIHLSDEYGKDPIEWYNLPMCKRVIRNYLREVPSHVLTLPLGYHWRSTECYKPWAERELAWSFHGTNWFDRQVQLEPLRAIEPHRCRLQPEWNHPTRSSAEEYLTDLGNSKFCPILKGQNAETFRLYEALEAGALPITTITDPVYLAWIEEHLGLSSLYPWTNPMEAMKAGEEVQKEVRARWFKWKVVLKEKCR